jgi:hypothetical protein
MASWISNALQFAANNAAGAQIFGPAVPILPPQLRVNRPPPGAFAAIGIQPPDDTANRHFRVNVQPIPGQIGPGGQPFPALLPNGNPHPLAGQNYIAGGADNTTTVAPLVTGAQIPNKIGANGWPRAGPGSKCTVNYAKQQFLEITGANPSGNLETQRSVFGLTRLTLNIPQALWDGMVIDLTRSGSGAMQTDNPDRMAAMLTCILANGFDPRRAPQQGHIWQNNVGLQQAVNGPAVPFNAPGAVGEVAFLNAAGNWPNQGPVNNVSALRNLINNPQFLRNYRLIVKFLAPDPPVPGAQLLVNAGAPHGAGRNHYAPRRLEIAVNRRGRGDALATAAHVNLNEFLTIRQNNPDYLRHLFHASRLSSARIREINSGTLQDPRWMTVGRIVIYFLDMNVNPGNDLLLQGRDGLGRRLRWAGCNDTSQIKFQKLAGYRLVTPKCKSNTNNCLLSCLRYGRDQAFKKIRPELQGDWMENFLRSEPPEFLAKASRDKGFAEFTLVRAVLKYPFGAPFNIHDTERMTEVGRLMRTSFRIFKPDLEEIIQDVKVVGSVVDVDLVFFFSEEKDGVEYGHLKYRDAARSIGKKCGLCGKDYVNVHSCSRAKRSYAKFALEAVKDPDCLEVAMPDAKAKDFGYKVEYSGDTVIYFDMETYHTSSQEFEGAEDDDITEEDMEDLIRHKPYSIGFYSEAQLHIEVGDTCLDAFLEHLQELEPIIRSKADKEIVFPYFLAAWNGAKYDFKLLLHHLLTSDLWNKNVDVSKVCLNNNRLLSFNFVFREGTGAIFQCFDPCLWIMSSLKKTCKDYGVQVQKDIFPHRYITSADALNSYLSLEDFNNTGYYFPKDADEIKKTPWDRDALLARSVAERDGLFSLRDLHDFYLEHDVMSMREICSIFYGQLDELFGSVAIFYMTISQFTFSMFSENTPSIGKIYTPNDDMEYVFFREATYGGRVYPVKQFFQSTAVDFDRLLGSNWQEMAFQNGDVVKNSVGLKFNELTDCLIEKDATSLYPAALSFNNYPVGRHTVMTQAFIDDLNAYARRMKGSRVVEFCHFIARVKYSPNRNLLHAILPKRTKTGISWDLFPGEGIFTSVDLEMAVESGYEVEILAGYYWQESEPTFRRHIERTFAIKEDGQREGNKAKRAVGKLMSNATFGKLLQAAMDSRTDIITSHKQLRRMTETRHVTSVALLNEAVGILTSSSMERKYTKPYHLGAFVLSYSRQIMFKNLKMLQPEMNDAAESFTLGKHLRLLDQTFYYTDTDCMYVKMGHLPMDEGKSLGQLKDESLEGSGKIILAIFLSKKVYAYLFLKPNNELVWKMACKGVREHFLIFSDYFRAVRDAAFSSGKVEYDNIKTFGADLKAFAVVSQTMRRTFNKTRYHARLPVDIISGEINSKSFFTVPHGHSLDSFGLGEDWWLKFMCSDEEEDAMCSRWGQNAIAAARQREQEAHAFKERKIKEIEEREELIDASLMDEIRGLDLLTGNYGGSDDEDEEEEEDNDMSVPMGVEI